MPVRLLPRASVLMGMLALLGLPGCAVFRNHAQDVCLRPCTDGFAETKDGWKLGIKHFRPDRPDPGKRPVVLCHGLGLNGTFWTLTENHLPYQLASRGYDVFVVDMRGSGASRRTGRVGKVNSLLRHTPFLEVGEDDWGVDHESFYDVPAILDYVERETGHRSVNWVGHSLGGMLMFPYLELWPEPQRIATFVAMGSPVVLVSAPETEMLRANRGLRKLLGVMSTSRTARFLAITRPPGLDRIDRFYYSAENVDELTVDRFYGYTLEDPGPGALRQLDHYLEFGRMVSADRRHDYAAMMDRVKVPTLYVAGEGDVLAPMDSVVWTYEAAGSADKTLARFGMREGHLADYGHCDLVWSRHAPDEVFPVLIDWLDRRQPGLASPQGNAPTAPRPVHWGPDVVGRSRPRSASPGQQEPVQANLRPGLELLPDPPELVEVQEPAVR